MTNLDVAGMAKKEAFFAAYEEAKAARIKKEPINTAPIRIDKQVERFKKTSFSEKEEKALFEDALSV
jgi:hypothetical protein